MKDMVYCGIEDDGYGGMTPIGGLIKDAWLFGILPEDETCKNWTHQQLQVIYDETRKEWDKYGCLVSGLPDDLRQRHADIHNRAIEKARKLNWDPELKDND